MTDKPESQGVRKERDYVGVLSLAFWKAFWTTMSPDLTFVSGSAGLGLLRRTCAGHLFTLLGGAALVFLGILDISFNAQHGIYRLGFEEALVNGVINFVCLGFGLFLILMVWKKRRALVDIF